MLQPNRKKNQSAIRRSEPLVIQATAIFFWPNDFQENPAMTRLELQTKRNGLVNQARAIHDLAAKEKREFTLDEQREFDKCMDESDKIKKEIDGSAGGGGDRGKRLSDSTADLRRSAGRQVDGGQAWGVEDERESTRSNPPLRFIDDTGKEVRGLLLKDSIRSAVTEELPDGMQASDLSFGRWIRAAVTGDWSKAKAEKRALSGSNDPSGGYLVPGVLAGDVIDLARNNSVCFKAGALTLPMDSSTLSLAKLTQDIVPAWKQENQPGAFADAQFGLIKLQSRTLMALASMSVELFEDAPNAGQLIETSLAKVLALEIDRAALRGDGSASSPTGVKSAAGVTVTNLATNGLALVFSNAYQTFSSGILTILNKNGNPNAVVMAPRTKIELDQLTNSLGDSLEPPPSWNSLDKYTTNSSPINLVHGSANTASDAILGDFSQMIVGMHTDLRIEITRLGGGSSGSAFQNLQVWIRAYLRADVVLAHPEFFCVLDGIL
jgi:HK97 family phage major capsid protein